MKTPALFALAGLFAAPALSAAPAPQVEALSRGLTGLQQTDGKVFLSWRLLANDPANIAFNVYRTTEPAGAAPLISVPSPPPPTPRLAPSA